MLQHPERLYRMSPHTFEAFVAEVYRGLGYSVSHTKRTRDGGVDLYLTKDIDAMRHLYIVQCKHSTKERRRIGVAYARQLLGVAMDRAVTAAISVTNVFFSADTWRFAKRHASRLFCVDQSGLAALMLRYLKVCA
jgi:restriction endonuclease Mrr